MKRWKPGTVLGTVILVLGFQIACGDDSPTAPTPLPANGVVVYEDPNFRGMSRPFEASFPDLIELHGPCNRLDRLGVLQDTWDDCISSILVAEGWEATVYERDDYGGASLTITSESDYRDLDDVTGGPCGGDWDDCISSIRVTPPGG